MVATVLAAALVGGCGRGEAGADRPYARMEQGLERALERARAGDAEGARREFFDNAHEPLHRLAAQAGERDRASAARLLEAKQAVERSLTQGSASLADDLAHLADAARRGLAAVGESASPASGRGG